MEGNQRGIMLSQNANHDIAIVGNTLINNGSIDIAPFNEKHQTGKLPLGCILPGISR